MTATGALAGDSIQSSARPGHIGPTCLRGGDQHAGLPCQSPRVRPSHDPACPSSPGVSCCACTRKIVHLHLLSQGRPTRRGRWAAAVSSPASGVWAAPSRSVIALSTRSSSAVDALASPPCSLSSWVACVLCRRHKVLWSGCCHPVRIRYSRHGLTHEGDRRGPIASVATAQAPLTQRRTRSTDAATGKLFRLLSQRSYPHYSRDKLNCTFSPLGRGSARLGPRSLRPSEPDLEGD